jgi:DNA/RNA-binding protein KIN17
MRIFAENPNKMLNEFSRDFEKGYLKVLSHRHGTVKVSANKIYQEYIADKEHVHMNATAWSSLSGFCQYLGREGKCIVEETEKGIFIQYIDQDPKALERKANMEARQLGELNEEERQKRIIEAQIAAAAYKRKDFNEKHQSDGDDSNNFLHRDEGCKIALDIGLNSMATKKRARLNLVSSIPDNYSDEGEALDDQASIHAVKVTTQPPKPVVTEVKEKSVKAPINESTNRKDHWLYPNIVIKVLNDKVCDGKYYKEEYSYVFSSVSQIDVFDMIRRIMDEAPDWTPLIELNEEDLLEPWDGDIAGSGCQMTDSEVDQLAVQHMVQKQAKSSGGELLGPQDAIVDIDRFHTSLKKGKC